jgi:hypothetical protein
MRQHLRRSPPPRAAWCLHMLFRVPPMLNQSTNSVMPSRCFSSLSWRRTSAGRRRCRRGIHAACRTTNTSRWRVVRFVIVQQKHSARPVQQTARALSSQRCEGAVHFARASHFHELAMPTVTNPINGAFKIRRGFRGFLSILALAGGQSLFMRWSRGTHASHCARAPTVLLIGSPGPRGTGVPGAP